MGSWLLWWLAGRVWGYLWAARTELSQGRTGLLNMWDYLLVISCANQGSEKERLKIWEPRTNGGQSLEGTPRSVLGD